MTAKEKLFDYYSNLMLNGKINSKSVGEICSELNINRATFYKNFSNVDLLESYVIKRYVKNITDVVFKDFNCETYRDFDPIALKFLYVLEDNRKYLEKNIFALIKPKWLIIAFDELYSALLNSLNFPNDLNRWLAYHAAVTMIFWGIVFMKDPDIFEYKKNEKDILKDYISNFTHISDVDNDPYELYSPDMLDIIMALIESDFKGSGIPKTVSALCKEAGITRQAFYRQFSNLADCKSQALALIRSFATTVIKRDAFNPLIRGVAIPFRRSFIPKNNFNFFQCSMSLVYCLADVCLSVCRKCIIWLETEEKPPSGRNIYFHLYFYISAFIMTGVNHFYYSDEKIYAKAIKALNDYRKTFPELNETLLWLGKKFENEKN